VEGPKKSSWMWLGWVVAGLLLAGAAIHYAQLTQRREKSEERQIAQALVENAPLPAASQYPTIHKYLQAKRLASQWAFERTPAGLYNVSLSLPQDTEGARPMYAFETNLQVQSVRGINTAGIRLLNEGFINPAAKTPTASTPAKPKKSPADFFPGTINDRRQAYEQGDFDKVWEMFSEHRKSEMAQGGITQSGFIRMQKLSYRMGSPAKQTIVKTKEESDSERLVLVKQSQAKHPDIFIKQRWIWEDDAWRLDDEEKKIANETVTHAAEPESAPASGDAPAVKPVPKGLPGLTDPTAH
jgi:hypothetical protein